MTRKKRLFSFPWLFYSWMGLLVFAPMSLATTFGLQAGAAFPEIKAPADISSSPQKGYLAGISLEFPSGDSFSFRTEANLSQKKWAFIRAGISSSAEWNTLEIPLLLKARFGSALRPYLVMGPVVTLNFSRTSVGGVFTPRPLEWGGMAGIGLDLGNFFTALRYEIGLTDLDANSAGWRSRGFQVLVGFNFG